MPALTADRNTTRETQDPQANYAPVAASTTIFRGSIVFNNASGYAVPAEDTANFSLAGVAREQVDNSAGANGDKTVELYSSGIFHFAHSGLVQADVGKSVYAVDDQTVALAATTTNDIKVGTIKRWISSSSVAVELNPHTGA